MLDNYVCLDNIKTIIIYLYETVIVNNILIDLINKSQSKYE